MKIFVAIPGRGHSLDFNVTACLMEEHELAAQCGVKLIFDLFPSSGGIADGRNFLVEDFLKSDCDRMVFLDSDITFEKGALIQLATKPVDFVGGAYRYKQPVETYPIRFTKEVEAGGNMWADKNGLLEVDGLPFGFLCLTREVFKKFDDKFPERKGNNFGRKSTAYFQLPIIDGILWGEDYTFCKEWRAMGEKIYLDPEIELTHWDMKPVPYKGHIGKWLKSSPNNIIRRLTLIKEQENGERLEEGRGSPGGSEEAQKVEGGAGGSEGRPSVASIDLSKLCVSQEV